MYFPPSQALRVNVETVSGISGSISIACWVVVFSPQIIENFRRGSADGLSLLFLVVWLAGDVFNILGAVLQGVLPTMIILAVYYTLADIVLLGQCFYYRGLKPWQTKKEDLPNGESDEEAIGNGSHERTALLHEDGHSRSPEANGTSRPTSPNSTRNVDASHLSPATPLVEPNRDPSRRQSMSIIQSIVSNLLAIIIVCAAGVFGWWVSNRKTHHHVDDEPPGAHHSSELEFNVLGQVFGYFCAVLYLGSRVPQILLNHRRKSTEGVSLLFFLFACIGNLTYVLSILAFYPYPLCKRQHRCGDGEAARIYGQYIAVNASWLIGSLGTLFLDLGVFAQFFIYRSGTDQS